MGDDLLVTPFSVVSHQIPQARKVTTGETQATMRVGMRPNVACDSSLLVPAKVLDADRIEDALFHEIRNFAARRVIKEKRQVCKASVRVLPECSRFAG